MQNETANPANANFNVKITGTTNMTSTLGAYGFAAKGHYYQMSEEAYASKPKIVDKNGQVIPTSEEVDDTYLGVEKYSGACLIAMERIFMNMVFYGDDLFQKFTPEIPEYGYFFPLFFVNRNSKWTQQQVDNTFKPLAIAMIMKWVLFALLLALGIGFGALMVCYGLKYRKLRKEVYPDGKGYTPLDNNDNRSSEGQNGHNRVNTATVTQNEDDNNSEDGFEGRPNMQQQERPFSLHNQRALMQGRPITSLGMDDDSRDHSQEVFSGQITNQNHQTGNSYQ